VGSRRRLGWRRRGGAGRSACSRALGPGTRSRAATAVGQLTPRRRPPHLCCCSAAARQRARRGAARSRPAAAPRPPAQRATRGSAADERIGAPAPRAHCTAGGGRGARGGRGRHKSMWSGARPRCWPAGVWPTRRSWRRSRGQAERRAGGRRGGVACPPWALLRRPPHTAPGLAPDAARPAQPRLPVKSVAGTGFSVALRWGAVPQPGLPATRRRRTGGASRRRGQRRPAWGRRAPAKRCRGMATAAVARRGRRAAARRGPPRPRRPPRRSRRAPAGRAARRVWGRTRTSYAGRHARRWRHPHSLPLWTRPRRVRETQLNALQGDPCPVASPMAGAATL
jgi:hypothetical protein